MFTIEDHPRSSDKVQIVRRHGDARDVVCAITCPTDCYGARSSSLEFEIEELINLLNTQSEQLAQARAALENVIEWAESARSDDRIQYDDYSNLHDMASSGLPEAP